MRNIFLILLFVYSFSQAANAEENQQPELRELEQKIIEPKAQQDQLDINNSFITKYEYGKMLYNNPRGIGCNSCHGNDARGKKMVDFKQQLLDKRVYNCSLVIPDIKNIDYETFSTKVNSKKNPNLKFEKEQVCEKLIYYANVMPTYFLVEEEIEAIFYYIQNIK
ncbi:MAG: c-type cytochrome [Aliarcobacter sp.]|nr:c-type cytochrome [Aliarcobacter sp.]